MNDLMSGTVYILTNAAMPGYVKVGITSGELNTRLKQLDTTSLPLPFECFYAATVSDCRRVERLIHDAFDNDRVRSNREFFQIEPERIRSALKLAEINEITPTEEESIEEEGREALQRARRRNPTATFEMVGIPVGSQLRFSKDPEKICHVVNERQVECEGQIGSLSSITLELLHELGYEWSTCNGWAFWTFQGKPLSEYYQEALALSHS